MSQSEGWYTCICYSYNGTADNIISIAAGAYLFVQGGIKIYYASQIINNYFAPCFAQIDFIYIVCLYGQMCPSRHLLLLAGKKALGVSTIILGISVQVLVNNNTELH